MRLIKISIICLAVAVTGCASGIKYKEMAASIPPVAADKGRIFFYRTRSMMGAAVQPSIVLDGATVGNSRPGGFFYVDTAPGVHEIKVATEAEKTRTLRLALQEIKYVKTSLDFGFLVGRPVIDVMDPEAGMEDLPDLSYTGSAVMPTTVAGAASTGRIPNAVNATDTTSTAAGALPPASGMQAPATQAAALEQAFTSDTIEKWDGVMSCDARRDNMPRASYQGKLANDHMRAAYRAKFAAEFAGAAVRLHREPSPVEETLSGQVVDNMLVLSGDGHRADMPGQNWQIRISGAFQPGAPVYSGRGNMTANGSTIRNCELTMTRAALWQN